MGINRVCVSGNLTRDPEVNSTAGGSCVMKLGVAVNERAKKQRTGEWEDRPNFIDCTMFGARAESVSRFLAKGAKVCVEGRLRQSSWEDRVTGAKRSRVEVIVDEIEFMSGRDDGTGAAARQPRETARESSIYDEDIPF